MALKTLVKVGSITNLSDARYCAGMGVDFLGFRVVEGQQDAIPPKTFQEIRGWITGPQIVAEIYGIRDTDSLQAIIADYQPDYLELSLEEWPFVGRAIALPFILAIKPDESLPDFAINPAYILVDVQAASLSKLIAEHEILAEISGKENLEKILHLTGISGVSLTGGHEISPGLKQYDDLAEILEALETD